MSASAAAGTRRSDSDSDSDSDSGGTISVIIHDVFIVAGSLAMSRAVATFAGIAFVGAFAACAALIGVDEVGYGPRGSANGAGGEGGVLADASSDAGASVGNCDGGVWIPQLDSGKVHAPFCIDALEVSVGDYGRFLQNMNGNTFSPNHERCAWKQSHEPGCVPSTDPAMPIACIDWCDAWAYCLWAGKRLCGGTDGGAAKTGVGEDGRWYLACSRNGDGLHAYPYGNERDASACNGMDHPNAGQSPLRSGSLATCQGGFAGLFDMSGNVNEWVDGCEPASDSGAEDQCRLAGGSCGSEIEALPCGYYRTRPRNNVNPAVGVRCCWDP